MIDTRAIGSSGLAQYGGVLQEEFLRALQGPRGIEAYSEMRDNSAIVGALLYAIETLFQQAELRVVPSTSATPKAEDAAEFLTQCFDDMEHTSSEMFSEVMSMLPFGWALLEVVLKQRGGDVDDPARRSRYNDGRIGWRKIALRAQSTLHKWEISDDGEILGMWQIAMPRYLPVFIPIERAALFRLRATKNNPEGRSLLRNAYRSWFFQKRIEELEAIGIERDAAGLPVLEVPEEYLDVKAPVEVQTVLSSLKKSISQVRRGEREGLVVPSEMTRDNRPSGFRFRLLASGGSRQFDSNTIVTRHEQRIAMTVLAEFMMLGMQDVGSRSLASAKTSLFASALGALQRNVASTFNRCCVAPLMRLNGFDVDDWPHIEFGDIESPELAEVSQYVSSLLGVGALTSGPELEARLREIGGLPDKPEIDEAEEIEEAQS